jgi:hypothetical protein
MYSFLLFTTGIFVGIIIAAYAAVRCDETEPKITLQRHREIISNLELLYNFRVRDKD